MKVLVFVITLLPGILCEESHGSHHQFCIVGAGPGGLQMGYFLHKANRDFVIFEKSETVGSFYLKYPRHRTLISINKRNTGSTNREFNFRHDWNSLISDNASLEMRHYTDEYFPQADIYYQYLNDFAQAFNLNIQFNTEIAQITNINKSYILEDQHGVNHTCESVVLSTGLWKENIPYFPGVELAETYSSASIDPKDFEEKTVFILGRGNAGFETAQNLVGSASYIHICGRSSVRLAYQTHYVGDLRAINNQLVDTYQLKSLDGFFEFDFDFDRDNASTIKLVEKNGKFLFILPDYNVRKPEHLDLIDSRDPVYDRVILCTGFKFDFTIFSKSTRQLATRNKRYPAMQPSYESTRNDGLFFAGTVTHSIDYRRSAGGFIHGFRYTARSLFRHMEWKYFGVPWPSVTVHATDLAEHFIKRINEASGLYQMFGVLCDIAILRSENTAIYLEDVPIGALAFLKELTGHDGGRVIVFNFEYGANFSMPGKNTLSLDRAISDPIIADKSNFLHPVFYYYEDNDHIIWDINTFKLEGYDRYHHVVEDFNTDWTGRTIHIVPLRRFFEAVYKQDLRHYTPETCFKFFFKHGQNLPFGCHQHLEGQSIQLLDDVKDKEPVKCNEKELLWTGLLR